MFIFSKAESVARWVRGWIDRFAIRWLELFINVVLQRGEHKQKIEAKKVGFIRTR